MERAMRIYNGKPLINSVNGKDEVMDAVFPLVKKYGGTVVALALDENGIPDNADGRIAIAKRIYEKAASYGIVARDIIIDGLAMTISSDNRSALATLETLRRVRDELGGHTILGCIQHFLRTSGQTEHQRGFLHHGYAERPERRHHQSQFRGYDAGVFQLLCAGRAG